MDPKVKAIYSEKESNETLWFAKLLSEFGALSDTVWFQWILFLFHSVCVSLCWDSDPLDR